uniref:Cytochrome P450 n=1 Tax=Solanum lycopersicum TaxID=4081 RepID=A0A3Q7FVV7_SOLLC
MKVILVIPLSKQQFFKVLILLIKIPEFDIDFRGQDYEFIPFGSGRRSCPGTTCALQVEYLTIGHLIQGFDYKTRLDEPLDMKEGPGMTMRKVNPVEVIITPRLTPDLYKI